MAVKALQELPISEAASEENPKELVGSFFPNSVAKGCLVWSPWAKLHRELAQRNLLRELAQRTCPEKLLREACSGNLLRELARRSCSEKLAQRQLAQRNLLSETCSGNLLRELARRSCSEKLAQRQLAQRNLLSETCSGNLLKRTCPEKFSEKLAQRTCSETTCSQSSLRELAFCLAFKAAGWGRRHCWGFQLSRGIGVADVQTLRAFFVFGHALTTFGKK